MARRVAGARGPALTDIGVSGSAVHPAARLRDRLAAVTLDHTLIWHHPARADRWLLVDAEPLVNADGRGTARGEVREESGRLVASFTQTVLLSGARPVRAGRPPA